MASVPSEQQSVPQQLRAEERIRAVYEEFELDPGHVAMLSDPENEYAWIQSNVTMEIKA